MGLNFAGPPICLCCGSVTEASKQTQEKGSREAEELWRGKSGVGEAFDDEGCAHTRIYLETHAGHFSAYLSWYSRVVCLQSVQYLVRGHVWLMGACWIALLQVDMLWKIG